MKRLLALALLAGVGGARAEEPRYEEDLAYEGRSLKAWLADLRSADAKVRLLASRVLNHVGPEARDAAPALLMALKNDDLWCRARAAWALGRTGPGCVPLLTAALRFDDARIRQEAARALEEVGPAARAAVPALRRALRDEDAAVRIQAAAALWGIAGDAAGLPMLRAALKDTQPMTHLRA